MTQPVRHAEYQYLDLLRHILESGTEKSDRTGTGTRSIFGAQMRWDLSQSFPLLTTKKVFLRSIIHELLWFVAGDTNLRYLAQNDVHIWDEWPFKAFLQRTGQAVPAPNSPEWKAQLAEFVERIKNDESFAADYGNLGPIYGYQWRHWRAPDGREIDQLAQLVEDLKKNPDSRRHIISAWNVADIAEMAKAGLPPCHSLFQLYVADGRLSCQLYQRSADMFLGVPFNIASYALLTLMLAQVTGLQPGEFVHTLGDAHIYSNHFEQVREQLSREPLPFPSMRLNPEVTDLFAFQFDDFQLQNYQSHPAIRAPIAV